MADEVRPALSAEEWVTFIRESEAGRHVPGYRRYVSANVYVPEDCHKAAALALHAQPFGFTNDDARALNDAIVYLHNHHYDASKIASIARRIAALLPPEE